MNNSINAVNETNETNNPKPYSVGKESAELLAQLGEKLGEFKDYDPQLEIPELAGTRIVKCLYKGEKQSQFVRIPTKHLSVEHIISRVEEIAPYILDYLQEVESSVIKEQHKNGLLSVACEYLSFDKIIESLEEKSLSGRLNKDKIDSWFDSEICDNLAVKFAAKLGLDENSSDLEVRKVEKILEAYKIKFSSLASGKTFINEADSKAMINVINECDLKKSLVGSKLVLRLENMKEKEEDLLLSL